MACARKSDREEILEVLKKMSGGNPTGAKRPKQPSLAAKTFGSDFRKERVTKVEAVKDSFGPTLIDLRQTTRGKGAIKSQDDKQDKSGQATQSSPQQKGQEIHQILADEINKGTRDGTGGEMLKKMEDKFSCEFIQAEVSISGFAMRKTQMDFWSGIMDAIAIREKDVLEVFVVDWKTTANRNVQIETDWWEKAINFKKPLYQCLVYRELLQAHFKRHCVDAVVGILLVPSDQSYPEKIYPGLCVDFQRMDKEHLLDGLKNFQWST